LGDPANDELTEGLELPGGTAVIQVRPDPQGSLLVWDGDAPIRFALFKKRRFFRSLEFRLRHLYEVYEPLPSTRRGGIGPPPFPL
jgi:hypothetical protein